MDLRTNFIRQNIKGRALNMGCSFGVLHKLINYNHLFGVDIVMPKYKIDNFVLGDVKHLPFKESSFDSLIAGELVEHIDNLDLFVSECKRVLKNGGIFILTTPNKGSWANVLFGNAQIEEHISLMNKKELFDLISKEFTIKKHFCTPYNITTVYKEKEKKEADFLERIKTFNKEKRGYKMKKGWHTLRNIIQLVVTPYQLNIIFSGIRNFVDLFIPDSLKEQQILLAIKE